MPNRWPPPDGMAMPPDGSQIAPSSVDEFPGSESMTDVAQRSAAFWRSCLLGHPFHPVGVVAAQGRVNALPVVLDIPQLVNRVG
jgi:hypothetical protein